MGIQINGQTDTVTATDGSINIGGDVTVPGVLTYEDVTSVDAVGLSTFQNGIHVTGGNVGINETSPDRLLHITVGSDTALAKFENSASSGRAQVQYVNPHGDWVQGIEGGSTTGDFLTYTADSKNIRFYTDGALRQKIQGDGKIIVGGNADQTANRNLSVVAASGNSNNTEIGLQPTNSSGGYNPEVIIGTTADGTYGAHMFFTTRDTSGNRTERLRITSSGNVGIGSQTPGVKLDVQMPGSSSRQNLARFRHEGQTDLVIQGQWGNQDIGSANGTLLYNSSQTLALRSGSSGNAHVVLRSTGNIGIGTDAASNKVSILVPNETSLGSNSEGIKVWDATKQLQLSRTGSSYSYGGVTGTGSLVYSYDKLSLHADTSNPIIFAAGGSERLRINSNGNLDIRSGGSLSVTDSNGNASGQASTTGAINCNLIRPYNNSNSSWNGVYFLSRNAVGGGAKSVGIVETGLRVGSFTSDLSATERIKLGTDGTITCDYGTSDGNHVYFRNDEVGFFIGSWGTGSTYPRECTLNASRIDNGTYPFLRLAGQGGIGFAVDANTIRGSILNTGEFRIGTTSQVTVSGDPVHTFGAVALSTNTSNLARIVMQERVSNWISFKTGGGTHYGTIARSGSGVSYGSNSDYRLKDNVENFSGGIDLVKRLRPVTFNWNELSGNEDTTSTQRGFLAHEVQEVEPAAVVGEKDEMDRYGDCYDAEGRRTQINVFEHQAEEGETWTFTSEHIRDQQLDPAKLVPILTAALKESIAKIESLEARLDAAGL